LKIYHDIQNFSAKRTVVTIGTFDGVHLGHQAVIHWINRLARQRNSESVIFTFYPHPRLVVSKDFQNLRLLTTLEEKTEQLEKVGIDNLIVYPFTREFAELTYEQFIRTILIDKLNMETLVVGHDHHLGKNRQGNFENIARLSNELGFNVERIDALMLNDVDISSSKIRHALEDGNITLANSFLGYPFSISGCVTVGNQVGRNIGFPTANVEAPDVHKIIPREGVYAVKVNVNGDWFNGMLNIGFRPTIGYNADHRTIEVHLFDFNRNIYKEKISVHLHKRLRDEQKFESLDKLKEQLFRDKEETIRFFSESERKES
jgi:riboflavin kinase / FMN adenylyltransferase